MNAQAEWQRELEKIKVTLGSVGQEHDWTKAVEKWLKWRGDVELAAALGPGVGDEGRHYNCGRSGMALELLTEWRGLVRGK